MAVNPLFGSNYKFDPNSGEFIHAKHRQLHGVIQQFWPDLRLVWIPKSKRTAEDVKPYALVDQHDKVLMWMSEVDMDRPDLVLSRLYQSDTTKHPPGYILTELEAQELARALLEDQKWQEDQEERRELAKSILRSPLNKYTVKHKDGRKVTYRS